MSLSHGRGLGVPSAKMPSQYVGLRIGRPPPNRPVPGRGTAGLATPADEAGWASHRPPHATGRWMQSMDAEHAQTVHYPPRPRLGKNRPRQRPAPAGIEPPGIDHYDYGLRSAPVTWSVTLGIDTLPMPPEEQELQRDLRRWANAVLEALGGDSLRYVVPIIGLQRASPGGGPGRRRRPGGAACRARRFLERRVAGQMPSSSAAAGRTPAW